MKEKIKSIPKPLKKQVAVRLSIGALSLVIAILMLAIAHDFVLSLPCWLLFGYMAFDGGRILYYCVTCNYVTVVGMCIGIDKAPIRRRVKTIYIQTEKGVMKVPVRSRIRKLTEGDTVTVYMPSKTRIYEHENNLVIFGYYAIDIIRQNNRNASK